MMDSARVLSVIGLTLLGACSEVPELPDTVDAVPLVDERNEDLDHGFAAPDRGARHTDWSMADLNQPMDALSHQDAGMSVDVVLPEDDIGRESVDAQVPDPEPPPLPRFDHLDTVVELAVPEHRVWAHLIYVDRAADGPRFVHRGYAETSDDQDFWPASTIKMFTATAALEILEDDGFSVDATATFFRETNGRWVDDVTLSFREIIHRTFDCSSNETYTLLLRFAGLDWLNQAFFVPMKGFERTALMRGYVTADQRPWAFVQSEPQRIIIREAGREVIREHRWSGNAYSDDAGCTVYNESGTGNCTTPRDMAEHLHRLMLHEELPNADRFTIGADSLSWYRGEGAERVLNNVVGTTCGGPAFDGVMTVFPGADYFQKTGLVREYRSSLHHVVDSDSGRAYTAALALDNTEARWIRKLAEELARMVKTPGLYVHLDSLRDYVNPVRADLVVVSDEPGILELFIKPFEQDGFDDDGWVPLPGASTPVGVGESAHSLRSICLDRSEQVHIRGRFRSETGRVAWSDLHYVIVDHEQNCRDE